MSRPCPLILGGMIRCPLGCEYGYSSGGAVNGVSVGDTATAESCGLANVEDVLPYVMGLKWLLEGSVDGACDDEVCWGASC